MAVIAVQVLDPKGHRDELQALLADPQFYRALAPLGLKFGIPNKVFLAEGRERAIIDPKVLPARLGCRCRSESQGESKREQLYYQPFCYRGTLTERELRVAIMPNTRPKEANKPIEFELLPYERRQTIIHVEPSEKDPDAMYVVNIQHTTPKGRVVGGLTVIFVPPRNFF